MVTQSIGGALSAVEKVADNAEKLASMATEDQQRTQEEIELKKLEMTARKVVHGTLKAASEVEAAWGSSDWGSNSTKRTEDITW
ncbi:MAG: hypothetical protein K6E63_07160 [Lachnospiraceae bacterium]|nr:hypothetical protein [Lachnospiraceae bacterium]